MGFGSTGDKKSLCVRTGGRYDHGDGRNRILIEHVVATGAAESHFRFDPSTGTVLRSAPRTEGDLLVSLHYLPLRSRATHGYTLARLFAAENCFIAPEVG